MSGLIRYVTAIAALSLALSGCQAADSELYWISKSGSAPSLAEFTAWKKDSRLHQILAAYTIQDLPLALDGRSETEHIAGVAGDFWSIAAVQPYFGRLLHPNDSKAVVLSFALFQRSFAADPGMLGREISIAGERYTVVGILPRSFSFEFPQLAAPGGKERPVDAYVSMIDALGPVAVIGKLTPGVRPMQAEAELQLIQKRVSQETTVIHVSPLKRKFSGGYTP